MKAAIALASTAAVLLGACGAEHGKAARVPPTPIPSFEAAIASPSSTGHAVAALPASPPDAEGNPACPTMDSWGPSGGHLGVAVSYWGHGADYVTVLVRTTEGPDVARSITVEPGQALQLFEFADTDPAAVAEVLVITNEARCYATADPVMRAR